MWWTILTNGMEFQKVGRERVSVPAGDFDCYKLEMGIGGSGGVYAEMIKFSPWYPGNEPRFLFKYEDMQGN